jgi:hypothetical protein
MDLNIDPQVLSYILGIVFPIIVGIVTKATAPAWVKALTLTVLSTIGGFLSQAITENGHVDLKRVFVSTVTVFVVGVATHFGLWKPSEVTGSTGKVQTKTADFGVGKPSA